MRVLVTGHRGLVGTTILVPLSSAGHEVYGFDIKDGNDICDRKAVARAMWGMDAVVHLAAIPHPFRREDYDAINRVGGENVVEAAEEAGVKTFVYMSSSDVYGLCGGPGVPEGIYEDLPEGPFRESYASLNHLRDCPYSRSKFEVEAFLWLAKIPNKITFRLEAPLLGPGDTRIGATCSAETLQRAVLKALDYEGVLIANLVDPHPMFDTTRLEALLAS